MIATEGVNMKNIKKKIVWMLCIPMLLSVCYGQPAVAWAADNEVISTAPSMEDDANNGEESFLFSDENPDAEIMPLAGVAAVDGSSLVKSVALRKADGTEVHDGDTISLADNISVEIILHNLVTDNENGTVNYVAGTEYELLTMPESFAKPTGDVNADVLIAGTAIPFGTLTYSTEGRVKLKAVSIPDGNTVLEPNVKVGANLDAGSIGDREEADIVFSVAGSTYTFRVKIAENVKTPPVMEKHYTTDISDSTLQHWTVKITEGSKQYADGWNFVDTVSGDIEYKGNWNVAAPAGGSAETLSVEENKRLSCKLNPSGTKDAVWTITYDTHTVNSTIKTSASGAGGSAKITSTIQNNANLYDAADSVTPLVAVSKGGTEEKDGLTVTKAGVVGTNADGSKYIDYTIRVNAKGYTFNNVVIYDRVTGAPVLASGANILFDTSSVSAAGGTVTYADATGHIATQTATENGYTYSMKVAYSTISGTSDYVISYRVTVSDWAEYRKYNEPAVNNSAWMTFEMDGGTGEAYKIPEMKAGGQTLVSGSLEKSVGVYDAKTNQITWTITVNNEKSSIGDIVIEDIIGGEASSEVSKHQEYVKCQNLKINDAETALPSDFESIDASGNVRFAFDSSNGLNLNGKKATFEVVTRLTDADYYQNNRNDDKTFKNTAKLYMDAVPDAVMTVSATCSPKSTVLEKSAGTYDYFNHTIPWMITVNKSQMALGHPVITDTLPAGLSLKTGTLMLDGAVLGTTPNTDGEYYTYDGENREIVVYLKSAVAGDTYRTIAFDSVVDVENAVFDGKAVKNYNGEIKAANKVSLMTDERSSELAVSKACTWDNQLLGKTGTPDGSGSVEYSVVVNKTGIELSPGTIVTDTLSKGLILSPSSIKLYKVTVKADGNYDQGDEVWDFSYDTESRADGTTILSLTLPDNPGNSAYMLKYSARATDAGAATYGNSVTMSGLSSNSNSAKVNIAKNAMFSGGGASLYNPSGLKIMAKDENGDPLAGATYMLSYDGHVLARATTDKAGALTFRAVDLNVDYVVEQVDAPVGYRLTDVKQVSAYGTVTPDTAGKSAVLQVGETGSTKMTQVEFTYALKNTDLVFTKVNESGEPLEDAEFTIYTVSAGSDGAEALTPAGTKKSDVNGVVRFTEVTAGEYLIRETASPEGYVLSAEEIMVSIDVNADITAFYLRGDTAHATVHKFENVAKREGTVSFVLHSVSGEKLAGGVFELYSLNGAGEETYVTETTSDADGEVTFTGLKKGKYHIRQTSAPYAYTFDNDLELTIEMEDNADGHAEVAAFYKTGDGGKTWVTSVTNTKLPTTDIAFIGVSHADERRMQGARFGLYRRNYRADGTEWLEILFVETSDSDGKVKFSEIVEGDYEIMLLSAPEGYSSKSVPIVLSVDGTGKLKTFYFKGEKEENLLDEGTGEIEFDVVKEPEKPEEKPGEKPTEKPEEKPTEKPEEKPEEKPTESPSDAPKEEANDDSAEDSNTYSGGIWNKEHTYLTSPYTGE